MTARSLIEGFDGLMKLSRREGVDVRPTLLRVLTDLYVQTPAHNPEEEQQFVALASRLIDDVDDTTRAVIRARLETYPATPRDIRRKLGLAEPHRAPAEPARESAVVPPAAESEAPGPLLSMAGREAAELQELLFNAHGRDRVAILRELESTPLRAAPRIEASRAARAIEVLEQAAFAEDAENFAIELGDALILPRALATRITIDEGGEPLACALRALDMPSHIYQRVLMFLDPARGAAVLDVYRLARLYDTLSEHVALVMLAAWRTGVLSATQAKYRALLHNDERQRARHTSSRERVPVSTPAATPLRKER